MKIILNFKRKNFMKKVDKSYITKAKLKGYKSIRDLEIDLFPDFNIIIGKNGSGKTNFLNFLEMSLLRNFDDVEYNFMSDIEFFGNNKFYQLYSEAKNEKITEDELLNFSETDNYYYEHKIFDKNKKLLGKEESKFIKIFLIMLKHGIPHGHLYLLEKPFNFSISNNISSEINKLLKDKCLPFFIHSLFHFFRLKYQNKINENEIKNEIDKVFNQNIRNNLLHNLKKFTDIQDIRLNKSFSVNKIDENSFSVRNLEYEFFVNEKRFPFSSLSDGLKRIFLIIAEVAMDRIGDFPLRNKIILIEEPELGIHPHQFFQLMTFLKEESRDKQIIISSHAPEVLDFLDKDELNRIIICKYEGEKGTTLKHLTEKEIKDAQHYIEDEILYLSNYWKHSDLENI